MNQQKGGRSPANAPPWSGVGQLSLSVGPASNRRIFLQMDVPQKGCMFSRALNSIKGVQFYRLFLQSKATRSGFEHLMIRTHLYPLLLD